MFSFLSFLWFIRQSKSTLFWIYLWQLKEYHTGRFLDHFRTDKGKNIFLNPLFILKLILVCLFFYYDLLVFFSVFFIYLIEAPKTLVDVLRKKLKYPVLTKKTILLVFIGLLVEVIFIFLLLLFNFNKYLADAIFILLVLDVFNPAIVSLIVLMLQPFAVLGRNRILKKAKEKRIGFPNLLVVGITGSYGKTSTKEFLYSILSEKFRVLKTKEHQNSEVGISQCILNDLKAEHEIFIVEMGAYNRGGIKLLCDITKPKIGILTGINEQHLATFGSLENIIKTKYELIESLPSDGIAFFNAKNKYCPDLYNKTGIKKYLYGEKAAFSGAENILGAVAVAKELGMTEEEITKAVNKIENKFPGIKIKKGINNLTIIEATYSANPDGIIAHLEYLKTLPGRKIIIMPCLIELGGASKEVHKKIGQKIAEACDLAIITTKDRFKEIQGIAGKKAVFIENPKEIFEKIKGFCQPEDVILLESRVPSQLINLLTG
jgi:UDP-N-acetylmuramoyl-tripeptide--D-alanyl-D-alanine ligase